MQLFSFFFWYFAGYIALVHLNGFEMLEGQDLCQEHLGLPSNVRALQFCMWSFKTVQRALDLMLTTSSAHYPACDEF